MKRLSMLALVLVNLGAMAAVAMAAVAQAPSFKSDFQKGARLSAGWKTQGNVSIDPGQSFKPGGRSLLLSRTLVKVDDPTGAVGPSFPVAPGLWDMSVACKSDINSRDSSFRGIVTLEYLDGSGKVVEQVTLADIYGLRPWQPVTKRLETPPGAAAARFRVALDKTWGEFRVDELSAAFVAAAPRRDNRIDRMYFSSANPSLGHFLYPDDPRVFTVTVEATEELPPEQLTASCTVRDYWGAEQAEPAAVQLTLIPGKRNGRFAYAGKLDLNRIPLEINRYYEIHGEIARSGDPYHNYSSFVIKPEAITNSFPAGEIPFSGRNWDSRIPDGFALAHRLGIRIMNLWSGWSSTPPYTPSAPCIDLIQKYKMGAIFGAPSGTIETHGENWEKYDDKALRQGVRNTINAYRKMAEPFIISLGNEPPVIAERLPDNVKAYQSIYEEVKKTDPTVMVLGTSIGPQEPFFKAGFGQWCDAYDFHVYEGPQHVVRAIQAYPALFQKYGFPKPIWATEIGMSSEGVVRRIVAIDMIKKFTLFFANGGANMSWFDLFYPDENAKIAGASGEAQDVFDSRYLQYAPKLTAVTYYDLVNSIAIKKFVEEKKYGGDIYAYLFRDRDNHQLQIVWKDKGRQDAFVPLAGVQDLQVIRLDGTRRDLNAEGKGATLTIGEDPLLLLYDGASPLAEKLEAPLAAVAFPTGLVRGGSTEITVNLSGAAAGDVNLVAPPFWPVKKGVAGQAVKFTLTCPETTAIREADLTITIGDGKGGRRGELYLRPLVTGQLTAQVLPVPPSGGKPAGVKLIIKNNGKQSQEVTWDMSLVNQIPLIDGKYEAAVPVTEAHFAKSSGGRARIAGGASSEFVVPLAALDSQTVYGVRATVTDASGRTVMRDRNVAGFIAVPKARGKIKLNGTLDGPDWKRAPVQKIDEKRQYFSFEPQTISWKGPQDLSATLRFLWDDRYLYVGVDVTDDLPGGLMEVDSLWMQDGLQFLIDPCRAMDESVGKYDYALGVGKKGPAAWGYLSADAGAPTGEAKDIVVSSKRKGGKTGAITYVIAFPWSRVAPFKPAPGANLGLTVLLNEDDGPGRKSFMSWFGNAHTKQVNAVGDLILGGSK